MLAYQVKVRSSGVSVYGGAQVTRGQESRSSSLLLKNDRFGEPVKLTLLRQAPTQPVETIECGVLQPDQAVSLDLLNVLRIEGRTLTPEANSLMSCMIQSSQA